MIQIPRKRPRKPRVFRPYLTMRNRCEPNEFCDECMAKFSEQVENERPGHVWCVEDGQIVYMEDMVMQHHLGRKLKENESVLHKNGNFFDNRLPNLELVVIKELA